MFKFVGRSKSVKKGPVAHGPESPASLVEIHPVSSRKSTKHDVNGPHYEGFPSPSASSLGVPGTPGGAQAHPSSPSYPLASPVPTMPERPRTSSGPGSNTSTATNTLKDFDKRKSKDDLSLMTRGTSRGGYKSYHIPIRGKPPSPADNRRDISPARTIPVRTHTPESIADNNGIITIGMAIGSPTHPPMASYGDWPPHSTIGVATSTTPGTMPELTAPPPPAQTPQRSKSTRWKLFGRSKSKRAKTEPVPGATSIPSGPTIPSTVAGKSASGLDRSNTERYTPKHRPIIVRTGTGPLTQSPTGAASFDARPSQTPRAVEMAKDASATTAGKSSGPMLDVEIPDITMERYSVMFGGLLQTSGSSSSLLARRQATLERLRTINDRIVHEQDSRDQGRTRRATSPAHERSPSLSMFPTPPPSAPPPTSPRSRSATVPSGLPSNPREGAQERKRQTQMQLQVPGYPPAAMPEKKDAERSMDAHVVLDRQREEVTPSQNSMFRPDQSSLVLDSPTEELEVESQIKEQLKPTIYEPQWEMVSPAVTSKSKQGPRPQANGLSQTQSSSSGSPRIPATATASAAQKHAKKTSEDQFDEAMLNAAVEVSIARQISISQQQRDMLRKNIGSGGGSGPRRVNVPRSERKALVPSPTGPAKAAASKNERLAATKTATPTLITPPEPFVGSPLAQHRKSERIIVEGA